ncbi:MAG: alpha/beta fold hydrolase [Succinivibrio sp.]
MKCTDNLTLGYTCYGDPHGQPMVVTPGWATDCNFLKPFVELFPKYNIMLVDMPGYGKSAHLKQFSNSTRQSANLLLNTIPQNSILVSWSLSTLVACMACYSDVDKKISGFISICGAPRFPADPNWPGFDYRYVLKSLNLFDEGRNLRSIKLFFKLQTQCNGLSKEQNQFVLQACEKMGDIDPLVLRNGLLKMAYADYREPFFSIRIPCLHIFGAKDKLVKQELSSRMVASPYHLSVVLQDSAHMPFLTEPENLTKAIELFIKNAGINNL